MSDIVERLRHQPLVLYGREQVIADISLLSEAADEIEFLNKVIEVERKEHKEAVEAERKKHEWVSVNDRLPEQDFQESDNKVAVLLEDGSVDFAHRMAGTTVFVSPSRVYLREVTHWWSLPDPPKEEK